MNPDEFDSDGANRDYEGDWPGDEAEDDGPLEQASRIYQRARETVARTESADEPVEQVALPVSRGERLWRRRHQFVFAGAFLAPYLVLGIIWLAAGRLDSDDGQPGTAAVAPSATQPADPNFPAHTVPAMIRDEIVSAGDQRGYQFEGRAGEVWHITVETSGVLDPQIYVYDSSGAELAYNDDQWPGSISSEVLVTLPSDGPYRVLVGSAPKSGGSTGVYLLSLFRES